MFVIGFILSLSGFEFDIHTWFKFIRTIWWLYAYIINFFFGGVMFSYAKFGFMFGIGFILLLSD